MLEWDMIEKITKMNDWDKDNLKFLLQSDSETIDEWFHYSDKDDIKYALELIRTARNEMLVYELNLMDDVEHVNDAKAALKNILTK
jgi:hypothetical protein